MYNELPAAEQHELEGVMQHDRELAETCAEMLLAQRTLNQLARAPRPETTTAILQYSRTFPL